VEWSRRSPNTEYKRVFAAFLSTSGRTKISKKKGPTKKKDRGELYVCSKKVKIKKKIVFLSKYFLHNCIGV